VKKAVNKRPSRTHIPGPAILLVLALFSSLGLSQRPAVNKPKLKDFGASLRQLQWDPKHNEAVDGGPQSARRKRSSNDDVVTVETTLVVSDVLVMDARCHPIIGLTAKDFAVTEDGSPQTIGAFALGNDSSIPRSIVLIMDYSISQLPFIRTSIAAAETLVDKLGPFDRMAIVTDDVELLSDFTSEKKILKDRLESLLVRLTPTRDVSGRGVSRKFGQSSQYSALMATLREAFDAEDQRPIIIFQTDGDEAYYLRNPIIGPPNVSPDIREYEEHAVEWMANERRRKMRNFSLTDVYTTAERARVTIYTVVPGFRLVGLSPEQQTQQIRLEWTQRSEAWTTDPSPKAREKIVRKAQDRWNKLSATTVKSQTDREVTTQSALAGVATITGGWTAFLEDPSRAEQIYSRIFSDINGRYIVGYYPTNKELDGKRRKINVEVKGHPEYTLMYRHSYWRP